MARYATRARRELEDEPRADGGVGFLRVVPLAIRGARRSDGDRLSIGDCAIGGATRRAGSAGHPVRSSERPHAEKGAFTGETSVSMAHDAGAKFVLVGHSERRHVFGETDAQTAEKVSRVLAQGLAPMLCVGEKIEEREAGQTNAVVVRQLRAALEDS
jgi:hypothetical protein